MNIKVIVKKIKSHGVKNVFKQYMHRKRDQKVFSEILAKMGNCKTDDDYVQILDEAIELLRDGIYHETKLYKKQLTQKMLREVLPEIYNKYSKEKIEDKILFLQPREGLNPSCEYIYNKLEEKKKYKLVLHELHRSSVSTTEYMSNAIRFIKDLATAKAMFMHESNNLLGCISVREETKVIQLWHGCGIFKKIGLSLIEPSDRTPDDFLYHKNYHTVTIASPEVKWVFEEFMGIDKNSDILKPIGVSRTDEFFDEDYIQRSYNKLHTIIPLSKEKKVILYAPTYRGLDPNRIAPKEIDVKAFADALSDEYIFIFKHHQTAVDRQEIPIEYENSFAYDMTRGKGMNINELMTVADIMITDYSSVAFEYSLFERPMLFYTFDIDEYIDERGLYYNFDEITPGPAVKTNKEMIDYISHIESNFEKSEVIDFKNKFMSCCDGYSTERIIALIEE